MTWLITVVATVFGAWLVLGGFYAKKLLISNGNLFNEMRLLVKYDQEVLRNMFMNIMLATSWL